MEQLSWQSDAFRAWLASQARDAVVGQSSVCESCPIAMWRRPFDGVVQVAPDAILFLQTGDEFATPPWAEAFIRALDDAHATESKEQTTYHEEPITAGECLAVLDGLAHDEEHELAHSTHYAPPGAAAAELRALARDYQDDHPASEFDWYFDPAFPLRAFEENAADADLWAWLREENRNRTRDWDRPITYRPDEQFYDSYWGWWSAEGALERTDCPVVIMVGDACEAWDGQHRLTIARLAQIQSVPVIVGIPKPVAAVSRVPPRLYGGKPD